MNDASKIQILENTTGPIVDLDCGEGANPDLGTDICAVTHKDMNGFGEDTDKPTSYTLTLGDELTSEINSTQGDKLEVGAVMPGDDGDGSYYVVVTRESDPTKTSNQFFAGEVGAGESFTASEDAFGTSFGSETYVHIFSSDGGTLLQTINFHTSCSAPLVIGDQYGSISLEGASLVGKDSGTVYTVGGTSAPGDDGVTYSIKDGPGSDLFEVNADGEVSFKEAPDFENPQGILDADGNPTNNYDVVVLATLADGTVTEKPLEICVEDDCIQILENTTGPIVDLDCGEGANPDLGTDICAVTHKDMNGFGEDTDKPTSYTLTLGDELTSEINSTQGDKLEVGAVMPGDDGDGSYYVVVTRESDPTKTSNQFFAGEVGAGESFTASEDAFGTSFGSETYVHIFSSDGGTLLQTINFHTSCSAPLVIGDQYGSISLEGASLVGKDSGTVYTVGGTSAPGDDGVTYSIKDGPGSDLFEVNADGEVSFKEAPDFENPQGILDADGNPTNNYDVVVLATLADGTVTEKPLEICVEDDCIQILENTTGPIVDLDCGEGANPDLGTDICAVTHKDMNGFGEDTDKPTSYTLTLGDELTSEINSTQGDKLEVGAVMPGDDGDGSYYVVVTRESDPTKTSNQFFAGEVGAGESFTASEDAFGTSFGSETYVHIFSSDGGTLLQTINFHTSCSAPLVIGDQYGSISLEGASLVGKDSGTVYTVGGTSAPGDDGVTYSIKDGPGSDLFEVNADGEVSFKEAPDFENPQGILDADGNPTNNYDVVVLATLADGTVTEKPLEICVEDDCIQILENTTGPIVDLDCGEGANPDLGTDICAVTHKDMNGFGEDTDKPTSYTLTLGDELTSEINSTQGDKLEVGAVMPGDDGDGSYYVVVTRESDPTKTSNQFFAGEVGAGESFTASEDAFGTSFGSETYVHIFSSDGGTLLQTINFHTSCSAPLVIGDQYGSISLEGASLVGKDSGTVYTVGGTSAPGDDGVTYSIKDGPGSDLFEVNADGEVSFKEAPDFENPQGILDADGNPTNNYDVVVLATLADGTVTEKPLEICVEDQDCVEVLENTTGPVVDLDATVECPVEAPGDTGLFVCQAIDEQGLEKPSELTLTLGDVIDAKLSDYQPDGKSSVATTGASEDGDGLLRVIVTDDDDPSKLDTVYFDGAVSFGESFTALASNAGDATFSSNTYIHILDDDGTLLQTIQYHTSCSVPIVIGDQVGSVTVSGVGALNNNTGQIVNFGGTTLVPQTLGEGDIVYSIVGGEDASFFMVDADTGEVSFIDPPDFEGSSTDGDNNYEVIVRATSKDDPDCFTDTPVEICVKDVPEFGSLSGRYFCDTNNNDIDDNNGDEPGIAGVLVLLRDPTDNSEIARTFTSDDGTYSFEDLAPGTYRVVFRDPNGVLEGKQLVDPNDPNGNGDDTNDSDAIGTTDRSVINGITVVADEDTSNNDAGAEYTASLGDFVFLDADADGIQDAGEAGIAGVEVTLTGGGDDGVIGTGGDDTTDTTTTDGSGFYAFTGLNPGEEYQVTFGQPTGLEVSPADEGGDDTVDSDGLVAPIVTLTSGENNDTIDQGFYEFASLGDFVWEDLDGDGIQDAGEPGVEGVTVELKDDNGDVIDTTTTDADGKYSFTGLIPGTYAVVFTPPPGYAFTDLNAGGDDAVDSDADPEMGGMTETVTLSSGEFNGTLDAGLVQTASLGDFVFLDADADGIQDAGEAGIAGVEVTLTGGGDDGVIGTGGDDTTDTTTTDGSGFYAFTGLNPGEEYQVTFGQPTGLEVSPADEGGDDTVDSDGLVAPIVTLTSGENNDTIDQGFYEFASLGDFVWEDLDGDGIQDAGEPGVEGVTVELKDDNGDVIDTTTTDADGKYSFTGLIPGTYAVVFTPPPGYAFTDLNAGGDDAVDSDADPEMGGMTETVTLSSGEFNGTLDAGLVQTASLGDFVFLDADADGIQDAGEAGIAGVEVTLTGGGDDGVIGTGGDDTTDTTTTDGSGFYAFTGLNPGEEYQVTFGQPTGLEVSPADEGGDDTVDSDGLVAPIVTLTSGENNDTIDQGFYEFASLGDFVWEDLDGDGIQDAGEPGVEGVTVELKDDNGDVIDTTTTDADGKYSFTGLIPGTYAVVFTPPPGYAFTDLNAGGDDAVDSDADPEMGGMTETVTLSSGEFNGTLDAGLVQTASLGDFVFLDADADGIQDAGEAGIAGVEVTLTGGGDDGVIGTGGDDTTDTTTTDGSGFYAFTGLNPGEEYQVTFGQPTGLEVSPADEGGDDTVDSDGLVAPIVTLTSGENNDTIDQGFYEFASLGDFVWEDLDGDGIQDAGEPGVEGVTVELKDDNGDVIDTTTTDADGKYSFTGLIPGTYAVVFTPPPGYAFTDLNAGGDDAVDSDADPEMGGMTETVTLSSGEFNGTLDAGLVQTASLGDFVFLDADADGIQDAGEAGIAGVEVTLTGGGDDGVIGTGGDDTTDTTTTDGSGFYAFTGLNPGEEYQVTFGQPTGLEVSPADEGGDDTVDSDGLVAPIVTLTSGENNDTIDQGFYEFASLGDFVWEDLDGDGIQDAGEPGVEGVTVELKDDNGDVIDTTTTDADGKYSFTGLIPGTYAVVFTPPPGYAFTDLNAGGDDAVDSDADPEMGGMTETVTLSSGEFNGTLDAGLVQTASLGDFVFLDADADGIQDAGEAGIAGVEVTLTGGGDDGVIGTGGDDTTDTTTTDGSGFYAFTGLNPGEEYQVTFGQPTGLEVSPADEGGDDTVDSDGLVAPIVTLTSGENNDTIDQGFYEFASLGDFVWEDLDGDGIQDAGEPGVEGVTVELKDDNGDVIDTTTTDADGKYSFTGLIPGTYAVVFTPPPGYAFTDLNAGGDDAVDSDADPEMGGMTETVTLSSGEFNGTLDAGLVQTASLGDFVFLDADADGIQDAGEAGIAGVEVTLTGGGDDGVIGTGGDDTTDTTTTDGSGFYAFTGLNPGEEYQVTFGQPTGLEVSPADEGGDDTVDSDGLVAPIVTLTSGENNDTIDQGFYEFASLGDFVWEDLDGDGIQDAGEPGVEGVTVELKDDNGDVIDTTTTDADGKYSFTGLIPGTYAVVFTPPPGYAFTDLNAGGDDAVDSDADPEMGGMTETVTLSSGEFNGTLDAGLVQTASLGDFVFLDADADGIQDAGEAGIAGVEVTLTGGGDDGVIGTGGDDTTDTTTTDGSGFYAFTGLNPGEEYQVTFGQPTGLEVSPADEGGDDTVDSDGLVAPIVTLTSGENNDTIDQGFYEFASLGDFVWEDLDGDGIQDAGEPGVEGVTVELKDDNGDVIDTTTTDADGKYSFTGLIPGTYAVVFTPPPGYAFTDLNAGGDDAVDSDADPEMGGMTETVTLSSGEFNGTLDAGLVQTASLGDFVFLDADADGIQDAGEAGIAGVEVTLTGGGDDGVIGTGGDDTTDTTTTDGSGFYAFTGLNPGEEYQVTFGQPTGLEVSPADEGGDDTVDSDGLVAPIVTLTSGENNDTIDQGFYEFASLGDFVWEDLDGDGIQDAGEPGVEGVTVELKDDNGDVIDTTTTDADGKYSFTGLIPGTYAVVFTPPPGYAFTDLNAGGDDAVDSDADPEMGGMTETVTLSSGEFNGTLDAGLVQTASLGDFVFLDADADGIQDAGEAGIAGVEVTLTGGGDDGVIGTGGDDTTDTTTTDGSGFYAFTGLNPGEEYQVTFGQPTGLEVSPADEGGDDTVDSDGLVAPIVTLTSGENNDTIDQGFYEFASLGDFVWEDLDGDGIQDAGEPGVEGVTVELKDDNGDVIDTTTTDADGKYSFTGLIPGTYAVVFTPPPGYAFTDLNAGGDDAVDSDADPEMGGMTETVTLSSGEFNGTLDAGLVLENEDPEATPDMGKGCADELIEVDLSDNISDPDGDPVTITAINGIAISDGGTIAVDPDGPGGRDPFSVTLSGDTFIFNGEEAYADLNIGQEATEQFFYTVSDGKGGEATSTIDVTFCGDANDYESLAASFPEEADFTVGFETVNDPDAFSITLSGTGDARFDGETFESAYCLSFTDPIRVGVAVPGDVLDVEGPLPGVFDPDQISGFNGQTAEENLDLIQWIVAQGWESAGTYGAWDIQFAIWSLTDDIDAADFNAYPLVTETVVAEILVDAAANGEGFSFGGDGDIVGAIVDPNPETLRDQQPFIIGFDFDDYDCLC